MKSKALMIGGFVAGVAGFLLLFKIFFLPNIPPEDEVPPIVVVLAAIVNGFLFGYIVYLLQRAKGN
jgi:branched-subunit amino acid ABC-type transport system permease component